VLCFDNSVEHVPAASHGLAWATDRNRFRAIEQLARTEARGGTEMLKPLVDARFLLTVAAEPGITEGQLGAARDRVLVLVTDGQVGNEDQILTAIGRSPRPIRIHVIGVDQAVNAGFLSRLAGAGRGRCELVESEDQLDRAAASIHRRIGAPLVTALALAGDGGAEPAAGPISWRPGDGVRPVARPAGRSDGPGGDVRRRAVRGRGDRNHGRQPGEHSELGARPPAGP
jgi:Ca-activated chloride channel family protein